jgi:hypothetical protein
MISRGGRPVPGFALGAPTAAPSMTASTAMAAVMVGATVGLLAHVMKASTGVALLTGAGAAVIAKLGIDRASA